MFASYHEHVFMLKSDCQQYQVAWQHLATENSHIAESLARKESEFASCKKELEELMAPYPVSFRLLASL